MAIEFPPITSKDYTIKGNILMRQFRFTTIEGIKYAAYAYKTPGMLEDDFRTRCQAAMFHIHKMWMEDVRGENTSANWRQVMPEGGNNA